ncbi:STAS domain-containing protein [Aquihabitans daechungensis]|uniref:STAS domain-containing protein n=1 Tax=Aquihabitans daechungensis TaxID=1052257 RepID=UPI003BA1BA2E
MSTPPQLRIEHTMKDDTALIRMAGELDMATSPELELQVDALFHQGASSLVFDCSDVSFMDSSALRVIVGAELRAAEQGGTVTVQRPSETVSAIMEVAGITDMVDQA